MGTCRMTSGRRRSDGFVKVRIHEYCNKIRDAVYIMVEIRRDTVVHMSQWS
jgi:hypothetical protein